jgi:hypothetical protein
MPAAFGRTGRERAAQALERLAETLEQPRALSVTASDRATLGRALERVGAQLLRDDDLVLTIALAGGSGVGKSTLINALAGASIAEAAAQRPCTMQATVYHHREATSAGLPAELLATVRQVAHERPELRFKVLVDTPDLDTFATQNRAATRALLKAAGLVVYVFTPEKYWDERVWTVIREEQRFSACLAVLNKSDTVPAPALERAADEIRRRFAELGKPDLPILRVSAARHIARSDGSLPPASSDPARAIDEFPSFRAYIEYELREGDIARMRTQQRLGVVTHLEEQLARVVPADVPDRLERLSALAETQIDLTSDQLAITLADRIAQIEADLRPLAHQRRNQRFFGPFRAWLSLGSLVTDGIPRLGRRLRGIGAGRGEDDPGPLGVHQGEIDDQLHARAARLRDAAFAEALPVDRWRSIAAETQAKRLLADLVREIHARFSTAAVNGSVRLRVVAWGSSLLGSVIPVALAAYALWALLLRLRQGELPGGLTMLGLVITLTLLSYIVLQALTSLALAGTGPPPVTAVGPQAIHAVLRRTLGGWIDAYRQALETDLRALREPVEVLRAVAEAPIERAPALPSPRPARRSTPAALPRPARHEYAPPTNALCEPRAEPVEDERRTAVAIPDPAAAASNEPLAASTADTAEPVEPDTPAEAETPAAPEPTAPAHEEPAPVPAPPTARPADLFRQAVQRHAGRSPRP